MAVVGTAGALVNVYKKEQYKYVSLVVTSITVFLAKLRGNKLNMINYFMLDKGKN